MREGVGSVGFQLELKGLQRQSESRTERPPSQVAVLRRFEPGKTVSEVNHGHGLQTPSTTTESDVRHVEKQGGVKQQPDPGAGLESSYRGK